MTKEKRKMLLVSLTSLAVLVVVFFLALLMGRYSVSPEAFWTVITGGNPANAIDKSVILTLRLPRTIVALLVGVALSLSGLVYQETFQNKLVSPDFLGVSTGAGFGATIAIVLGCTGLMISFTAFLFGILTMLITVFIAKMFRSQSQTTLLLSGIIVGGFMSAGISFIKFMADTDKQLGEIVYWLLGTFSKATMKDVWILLPIVAVCALVLYLIRWRINIVALGRSEATTLGLNYTFYRGLIIVISTLLTAAAVAYSGIVGWIGLIIPHLVRLLVGRDSKKTIPLTIMFGATFTIVCDIISRSFTASEIPLSAVTGFLGTPIFIAILYARRKTIYDKV
ncbi:MAG: iron ABC transporter permease [Clostridia bacterium]|nr:iron ABC transporter permease [Clostridia bacterium]